MANRSDILYIESLKQTIDKKNQRIRSLEEQKILTSECAEDLLQDLLTSFSDFQKALFSVSTLESDGSMKIPAEIVQRFFDNPDLEPVRDKLILTLRNHEILNWRKERTK